MFQGSGIGTAAFVVNTADLWPANAYNRLMKYADDTYLIVPPSASHSVEGELIRMDSLESSVVLPNMFAPLHVILAGVLVVVVLFTCK